MNECTDQSCLNGGTCVDLPPPQSYRCECSDGYFGTNCSGKKIEPALRKPYFSCSSFFFLLLKSRTCWRPNPTPWAKVYVLTEKNDQKKIQKPGWLVQSRDCVASRHWICVWPFRKGPLPQGRLRSWLVCEYKLQLCLSVSQQLFWPVLSR